MSTPWSAHWLQALHPLRIGYEWWSDRNPFAPMIAQAAQQVRERRQATDADNAFLQAQAALSKSIEQGLDSARDQRTRPARSRH